jgi:hypothetical protein
VPHTCTEHYGASFGWGQHLLYPSNQPVSVSILPRCPCCRAGRFTTFCTQPAYGPATVDALQTRDLAASESCSHGTCYLAYPPGANNFHSSARLLCWFLVPVTSFSSASPCQRASHPLSRLRCWLSASSFPSSVCSVSSCDGPPGERRKPDGVWMIGSLWQPG